MDFLFLLFRRDVFALHSRTAVELTSLEQNLSEDRSQSRPWFPVPQVLCHCSTELTSTVVCWPGPHWWDQAGCICELLSCYMVHSGPGGWVVGSKQVCPEQDCCLALQ